MPFVNVKYVRQQVNQEQKELLIAGVMDIIVKRMGRNPDTTVITIDEIDTSNWIIGGKSVDSSVHDKVCSIEIRISKGTSNAVEMADVIKAGKELVKRVLGTNDVTNYFIITELNPESWGFDGIPMTIRNTMEQNK